MTPGPRQTVDRAHHPTLGEGRAVYDNGPAFFLPDTGDPVPMQKIRFGGCGVGPPPYSNLRATTATGEDVVLDTTDRPSSDRHQRAWSPIFGPGWLVAEASPVYPGDDASPADKARWDTAIGWSRFEPDDGATPFRWNSREYYVGRLKSAGRKPPWPKKDERPSPKFLEWKRWRVIGDYEFRDEAPEGTQAPQGPSNPQQLEPQAKP